MGINPWVLHCDLRISGEDAESWNPGRWLDRDPDKVKHMERHLLALVAGKRTCLSKNIAMLEMLKLVAVMLLRYDVRLTDSEGEWKMRNSWVITQTGK